MSQQEALRKMSKLVNYLLSKPDASPFAEPVAWRELELFDYPEVIKTPMDLGTVKRRLLRHSYPNAATCASDIRLIWSNCMLYNTEGSDFWLLAKSFSKKFEDRYRKIAQDFDVGEAASDGQDGGDKSTSNQKGGKSSSSALSLDSKAKLAGRLFLLTGRELGWVMTKLEQECPEALELVVEPTASGSLFQEINIDAFPKPLFDEIDKYTADSVAARTAPSGDGRPKKKHKSKS